MTAINNGTFYHAEAPILPRFVYHAKLGLCRDVGNRSKSPKNLLEKIGDGGLWCLENLPRLTRKVLTDPRVVTVALTALALIATSFLFYPSITYLTLRTAISLIPFSMRALKFSTYLFIVGNIISYACRAEGRFWNTQLMKEFYGNAVEGN